MNYISLILKWEHGRQSPYFKRTKSQYLSRKFTNCAKIWCADALWLRGCWFCILVHNPWAGCHPPPSVFCIMRLSYMEYNFDFLSSCTIFVGTHFVAEVVLVSHATKKLHTKLPRCQGVGGIYSPLILLTILYIFWYSRRCNYCCSLERTYGYIFLHTYY